MISLQYFFEGTAAITWYLATAENDFCSDLIRYWKSFGFITTRQTAAKKMVLNGTYNIENVKFTKWTRYTIQFEQLSMSVVMFKSIQIKYLSKEKVSQYKSWIHGNLFIGNSPTTISKPVFHITQASPKQWTFVHKNFIIIKNKQSFSSRTSKPTFHFIKSLYQQFLFYFKRWNDKNFKISFQQYMLFSTECAHKPWRKYFSWNKSRTKTFRRRKKAKCFVFWSCWICFSLL